MNVNVSKEEYRLLMDMLNVADWVMHAFDIGPEKQHQKHHALRKKIMSYYKEMDAEDAIMYSDDKKEYYQSRESEEKVHAEFIAPYNEEFFWEELIDRLAERDVVKALGVEQFNSLDGIDRVMKVEEAKDSYANEFAEHGLDHIVVADEKASVVLDS